MTYASNYYLLQHLSNRIPGEILIGFPTVIVIFLINYTSNYFLLQHLSNWIPGEILIGFPTVIVIYWPRRRLCSVHGWAAPYYSCMSILALVYCSLTVYSSDQKGLWPSNPWTLYYHIFALIVSYHMWNNLVDRLMMLVQYCTQSCEERLVDLFPLGRTVKQERQIM